ncbi:uncharacterized protein K489DRAFT_377633 [Dissoconium aciculare CBS 342.82]|uniref:Uncharacterized protein n=1 Tax=Dissoconium aciculare CBS 342.82 TaxID=1314786 RepID=A0A6J3MB59_9PEZI|nr:uncharacterized protein K489DRAFT_377633 [Dissoconium aciculare CBS 342.82]KAF1825093.1 hypothetical protein K489DRAFT_377633 [Dissoconium aciculare CBS 342.82]
MLSDEKNVGLSADCAYRPEWPLGQWSAQSTDAALPATIATGEHHIAKPIPIEYDFLKRDLYPHRFHKIEHLIWLAGRPLPPRPLHQQLLLSRQLVLSESIDLHLVWKKGTIFVKPLPRYLLDRKFWTAHLRSDSEDGLLLVKSARGLLFSYTALVRHESDFSIAQAKRLLPGSLCWGDWQQLVWTFLDHFPGNEIYAQIDGRYYYGELRLGRLNKIYRLRAKTITDVLYGYSNLTAHNQKGDTFKDNLRLIGGSLAYLLIVLQAMQIGLATDRLAGSVTFQQACAGFAIFSILAPLVALSTVLAVFLFLLVIHVTETLAFEKRRFKNMNETPPRVR